ncbi:hypothetical protein [Solidesulfovibrio magneticus]|uniref:Uncharacterized protein n=1 Tax=Solidesulfovibrio magneticus (strain ATCC 700980 / DSM 13731 / RS-1) TaxID=573370 RepID=C4XJ35_SOLM1|nr:hypothetical protein [Solidesulfovibrio magneticus]BAH74199.1 hypothetical protein DMR_07080 [Solidesulfovibrio magneticus RS-1]
MDLFTLGVIIAGIVIGAAVTVTILRAKRRRSPPVAGRFDSDGYKESELGKRGLIDRTKWH